MKLTEHMKTVLTSVLWDMRNIIRKGNLRHGSLDERREARRRRRELDAWGVRYDLARWLMRPTTASDSAVFSRAMHNMDDMGLLVRVSRWGGRRTTHVRLTPAGLAAAERVLRERQAEADALMAKLGPIEMPEETAPPDDSNDTPA